MAHQQYMCVRSDQEPEAQISGHALMATCPPLSHISTKPDEPYPHKTWDIPNPDLLKLLDLSKNLPLDGELTPIMALSFIRSDERYIQLTMDDFQLLIDNLKEKSRCYGSVLGILVIRQRVSTADFYLTDLVLFSKSSRLEMLLAVSSLPSLRVTSISYEVSQLEKTTEQKRSRVSWHAFVPRLYPFLMNHFSRINLIMRWPQALCNEHTKAQAKFLFN